MAVPALPFTGAQLRTNLAATDTLLNASTVKTYQFEVDTFKKGSTAPTEVLIGTAPQVRGLRFDNLNQKATFTFMTPLDAKPDCDFQMMFMVAIPAGKTFSAGDLINLRVDFRVNFPASASPGKLDSAGTTVNTQTASTTGPFVVDGNDNVIIAAANTEFYTYMPHVYLPAASMVPGGVFWGEVGMNSITGGNVDSIVLYQMHVNYFEKSLTDQV